MCCLAAMTRGEVRQPIVVESVVLSPLRVAELSAQQAGLLREVLVEEGASVDAGAVLANLDSRQAQVDRLKAKSELAQAKAKADNRTKVEYAEKSLAVARAELRRSEESIEQFAKSISQSQLDVERLTVEKLALEKKQAEHELELNRLAEQYAQYQLASAEVKLNQHRVEAPFAGVVAMVRARVGEWLEVGAPVMRLVAVETLRAEGFLDADDASGDLVGHDVVFRGQSGAAARGRLKFVGPEMDAVTRQVRVWAELDNSTGELQSGEQGTLEIMP